ncbi:MAG: thiolase family protein [Pseudomonadota bacterium]
MKTAIPNHRLPVILAGARTPFLDSAGLYAELMSYELGAHALRGLLDRAGVDPATIELVIMGTVLHEVETTNVAREAMLAAGMPSRIPAYTVAMAGISPNVGVMNLCDQIALGRLDLGIAAGTENFSDVPVRLSQNIRRSLMKLRQRKGTRDRLKVLGGLRPADLSFDIPTGSDYTTGMTMGVACEAMVRKFGLSRAECDHYTARSHAGAIAATESGHYAAQIMPVTISANLMASTDNTPRADASEARLALLPPVFDRQHGIITAGNASRFTDGAAALLLGSLGHAQAEGLKPLAVVRDYLLTGVDSLEEEMLLGPAMSIPRLLARNGLSFDDIAVWEIHEAFAAQVLINRACMADASFVHTRLGRDCPVGEIPMEHLNPWGGSLSLGNPFAATGGRLFMTASQRLQASDKRYAVISTCAGGGLGAAILLEHPDAL